MATVPLYLPNQGKIAKKNILVAADIGGTKTNLGTFEVDGDVVHLIQEASYLSGDYASFEDILDDYLVKNQLSPLKTLSIGVAGPIEEGRVKLTNLPWVIDSKLLKQSRGIDRVCIMNDLRATAYGLAGIQEEDIAVIYSGKAEEGNMAILAPGTGLGEAGLYWDGTRYRPFSTEGGHSEFAPRTPLDLEIYHYLYQEKPLISWERLVSGSGIYKIYCFLRDVKGHKEPAWLKEKFKMDDPAAVVSHTAMRELNETCVQAMNLFVTYMAREAASLVLKLKAVGGLYLGGGIPPKIYPLIRSELFHSEFIQSDRLKELLDDIPVHLILNSKAALIGAAYYGAFGE